MSIKKRGKALSVLKAHSVTAIFEPIFPKNVEASTSQNSVGFRGCYGDSFNVMQMTFEPHKRYTYRPPQRFAGIY
jgi:hypothetical protein